MAKLNKVLLIGNVCGDPEMKDLASGTKVAGFSLAINEKYKGKDGEVKESVCFVPIEFFGKVAEIIEQYVKKGSLILVEGALKLDTWEKDGKKNSRLKVIGREVQFLGAKPKESSEKTDNSEIPF